MARDSFLIVMVALNIKILTDGVALCARKLKWTCQAASNVCGNWKLRLKRTDLPAHSRRGHINCLEIALNMNALI